MATGTNLRTYFDGTWHDGDVPVMKAGDHGAWLGTTVFDGARFVDGMAPDLDRHLARVNASAEALMIKPTVDVDEMLEIVREGLALYPKDAAVYIRPMYWGIEGGYLGILPDQSATGFAVALEEIPMAAPDASMTLTTTRFRRPVLEDAVVNAKAGCLYPNNARMLAEARAKGYTNALVAEALAYGDMGLALPILAPGGVASALTHWGSADQQATYLQEFAGENVPQACVAIAEPHPLFDPTALKTTAVRTPSGYRLDGEKSLVPAAADAEIFIVAAQLNGKPTLFIVEADTDGLTVQADPSMGIRAAALGRVKLDKVMVPLSARLGEDDASADDSARIYSEAIALSRLGWAALAVGTSHAVLDYVVPYVKEREAFGEPVAHPRLLLDLLVEVGDPDAVRPAHGDTGLDGGADVVGVDVAVPDAVTTHHHDGVAEGVPGLLESRHRPVGGVQEEHDLVAGAVHRRSRAAAGAGSIQRRPGHVRWLGQRATVDRGQQGVEQQQVAQGQDPAGQLIEWIVFRAKKGICAAVVKKSPAPRISHRHHIGIGRRRLFDA